MDKNKIFNVAKQSKKYIALSVVWRTINLVFTVFASLCFAYILSVIFLPERNIKFNLIALFLVLISLIFRYISQRRIAHFGYMASKEIRIKFRERIYNKYLELGGNSPEGFTKSKISQLAVEGVEQMELYFSQYLPQLYYSMISIVFVFLVTLFLNKVTAMVLLLWSPLIPILLVFLHKVAGKKMQSYWKDYMGIGDVFLENLRGLTTLKIYSSDAFKAEEMDKESEKFRKSTMRVLMMQLNSIALMDILAYGGAVIGIIVMFTQFAKDEVSIFSCIAIILLSVEYFLPLRSLGSLFHITMNGKMAGAIIENFLNTPVEESSNRTLSSLKDIEVKNLSFSYGEREVLKDIDFKIREKDFIGVVGESGSGKTTIANILSKNKLGYNGSILFEGIELSDLSREEIYRWITIVGSNAHIFSGTVRENLLMGNSFASEEDMWDVLKKVDLYETFKSKEGLDTILYEESQNISGGQKQRLAIARALLKDSPVYIFDEATANIDVDSELKVLEIIYELKKTKTVIFITHRIKNVSLADNILVLSKGSLIETGTHSDLISKDGVYSNMYRKQEEI